MNCPIDRFQCDFGACDTAAGQCHRLNCAQDPTTGQWRIAEGIAWFGFWIAAGMAASMFIYKLL